MEFRRAASKEIGERWRAEEEGGHDGDEVCGTEGGQMAVVEGRAGDVAY